MRIVILTAGTRGDVEPFVALGLGLARAGHDVTLAAPAMLTGLGTARGLRVAPIDDGLLRLKDTEPGQAALGGEGRGGGKLALIRQVKPLLRRMIDDGWAAAQHAEAIMFHPKALAGLHVAEKLGVPAFLALPVPMLTPTRAFPFPLFTRSLGHLLNRWSFHLARLISAPYAGMINAWRREVLGLLPRGRFAVDTHRDDGMPVPVLYPCSPALVPPPVDYPQHVVLTGAWSLDADPTWTPPPALEAFLTTGPPPVYIGFGSMPTARAQRLMGIVLDAVARAGVRALLAGSWGVLAGEGLPAGVHVIDAAPHAWLFPRMAAVVHHGGAGTTHVGLRAGKPTVVVPFFGDQPFWGERVHVAGCGPRPIPLRALTAKKLADAIRQAVGDGAMRERAAAMAARMRAEDGVARAIEWMSARLR
jgi:sterol 3beta-glucosyltransferase